MRHKTISHIGKIFGSREGKIAFAITVTLALPGCTASDNASSDTLSPLVSANPTTLTIGDLPVSTVINESTIPSTAPLTTTALAPQMPKPFPTSVPSGQCTASAIGADFGKKPESGVGCAGAWAVTRVDVCPPDTECEGLDVFRWTGEMWQHRGFLYSLCQNTMDASGLPRWAFDELIGFSLDCETPLQYVSESSSGPLSSGDNGPRVARLQQRLRDLSLLRDKADGYFGPNTNNAVIDFQFLVGLNPDGIVGPDTASALGLTYP